MECMKGPGRSLLAAVLTAALPLIGAVAAIQGQGPAAAAAPDPLDPIPFQKNGPSDTKLWGYADASSGRLVIAARFEEATRFSGEGLADIKRDGRWGMIDRQGREVIPARNSYHVPMVDGLAGACRATDVPVPGVSILGPRPGQRTPVTLTKCGYFDRQGQIAIPFIYDWIHPFREGVAPVTISRRSNICPAVDFGRATMYGMVNAKGQLVLPIEHCFVGPSEQGWSRVVYESHGPNEGRVGFVDREGHVVLAKLPYDFAAEQWRDDLLAVRTRNFWGVIDRKGREILPVRYHEVAIAAGRVRARLDKSWGYFDASGKALTPMQYGAAGDFSDGLACVQVGERHGFIDTTGTLVIEPRFNLGSTCNWAFSEGLRATPQGGKWGYIDRTGTFVVPPQFDEAWGFSEGVAAVRTGSLWGFVDRTGAFVVPPRYFRVDDGFIDGYAHVTVRINDPCCQGIYKFSHGFLNHQGREFFDAP
jgi:hypothetical protein